MFLYALRIRPHLSSVGGLTLVAGCMALIVPSALAQPPTSPTPSIDFKLLAFDVVSIRPSQPNPSAGNVITGITPDGYRTIDQPLIATLLMAYYPQGMAYWTRDRLSGAPTWLSDHYDIDAKVSEADRAAWQKQGLTLDKKPMFREMLQTMLADRCHLVAHMVPGPPISGWSLDLGKHDPHLTESKPGATLPTGMKLSDGSVRVEDRRGEELHQNFYNATMADLTDFLKIRGASRRRSHRTHRPLRLCAQLGRRS